MTTAQSIYVIFYQKTQSVCNAAFSVSSCEYVIRSGTWLTTRLIILQISSRHSSSCLFLTNKILVLRFSMIIILMGNVLATYKNQQIKCDQAAVNNSVDEILNFAEPVSNPQALQQALRVVNLHFYRNGIFGIFQDNLLNVNQIILKIWFDQRSESALCTMLKYWIRSQVQMLNKNILTFKIADVTYVQQIVVFLLCIGDDRLCYTLNHLNTVKLNPISAQIKKNLPEINNKTTIFQALTLQDSLWAIDELEISLIRLIRMNTNLLTRTKPTLQYIIQCSEHMFVVLAKILLNNKYHIDILKQIIEINPERLFTIATFMLSLAADRKLTQMFDVSTMVLCCLLDSSEKKIIKTSKLKSFPSHLFPNLPIIDNNLFDLLFCSCLYGLALQHKLQEGENFSPNRFYCIRTAYSLLFKDYIQFNKISYYYLEQICLHLKTKSIERLYLTRMIKEAVKLKASDILTKVYLTEQIRFSLNFKDKRFSLDSAVIYEFLASIPIPSQMSYYVQRYVYGQILNKIVKPDWEEAMIWQFVGQQYLKSRKLQQQT